MKNKGTKSLAGLTLVTLSVSLISCTKSIPYKEVYKEKVTEKSVVDTSAEYLFVASTDTASRDDLGNDVTPYYQGDERVVRLRFTEDSLQAVAVDLDGRSSGAAINSNVLLNIPVKHVEYRCAEDRYKKCTNREEENNEKNWAAKAEFIPDFSGLKMTGVTMIPVEMDKVFGMSCMTETASRLLSYEITADGINVQLEKTLRANIECLNTLNLSSVKQLESQVVFHYSLIRRDKLVTKGFKAVDYPSTDETTFGFFTTDDRKMSPNLVVTEEGSLKKFMNHWNPNRKEVVYYLSDNFEKPKFKSIKAATQLAFRKVNDGLEKAGVGFRLVLKDAAQKAPGDIRNSMIVMVEDPIASGPLGYGPSVADPKTGEIVSARTVMYYGNLLQGITSTYDEVVREIRAQKTPALTMAARTAAPASNQQPAARLAVDEGLQKRMEYKGAIAARMSGAIAEKTVKAYQSVKSPVVSGGAFNNVALSAESLKKVDARSFDKSMRQTDKQMISDDVVALMGSRHCNYPAELFPFDEAIAGAVKAKLGDNPKNWVDLSDSEKEEMIALIAPEIWVPTLVHELGHNLGLRHNFGGSEDKPNFYSKEELAAMKVDHEVPYSSVMDYGYSELNLLPTLGKYDVAALRFGYTKAVETESGELVKVKTTLKDLTQKDGVKLKDYQFCTDEHVEVNPNCKRFDKGTNAVEIVDFMIKQYEDYYRLRNFRNGRANFSVMSDVGYYQRIRSSFGYMRAFMERYENIRARFRLPDDSPLWEQIGFLKETKQAAVKAGTFLAGVLKTPDTICAVALKSNPTQIVELAPLDSITSTNDAFDCFEAAEDDSLKEVLDQNNLVIVAQGGKSFNHRKSSKSDNNYADQIDQRGVWLDKLAAARALFNRRVGNSAYDKVEDNFLDLTPELTKEIANTVNGLLLDQVETSVTFRDRNGDFVLTLPKVGVKAFTAPDKVQSREAVNWTQTPMSAGIAKALGVPMRRTSLQEILLGVMDAAMPTSQAESSQTRLKENRAFMSTYKINRVSDIAAINPAKQDLGKRMDGFIAVASEQNAIGQESIQISVWSEALQVLKTEELDLLIKDRAAAAKLAEEGEADAAKDATNQEIAQAVGATAAKPKTMMRKAHLQIPVQVVQAFKAKALPESGLLNYLITLLPNTNF